MRILILVFTVLFNLLSNNISNADERNYYQELVNDWNKIFPDQNRNAAGPKFFKHIISKDITYQEFLEFNKLYCAVSGSLINPNSEPEKVYLTEVDTKDKICGDYYRCCIPCSCDVMKYAKVKKMKHKFKDVEKEFYVLTIKNPCGKKDFPKRVNRDYFCDGKDLAKDQVVEIDNRLVIGLFYEGKLCTKSDIAKVDSHQVTGMFCEFRNNTPLEQLKTGMGDIFIKLAR
mgnify:FL=1|tara:strand:- start:154 stop:843 length:690 start_codon:yes stop_codon:yes gene_type:complete